VVLVLGGLGSLRGTIVASLLVGQVQTLGAVVMPEFALVVVFAMMGLVLLVRPRGLLNLGRLDDGH
jgi:branched-chain amino acid transport system permease protein